MLCVPRQQLPCAPRARCPQYVYRGAYVTVEDEALTAFQSCDAFHAHKQSSGMFAYVFGFL